MFIEFETSSGATLLNVRHIVQVERHFDKLNDQFGSVHREISSRCSLDSATVRLVRAASSSQQPFACCQQFAATHRIDDGLVPLRKDAKRVSVPVSTHRLPLVHTQDGAIKERPDNLITLPTAVPKYERERRVTFIVIQFQQSLTHFALSKTLCHPESPQQHREQQARHGVLLRHEHCCEAANTFLGLALFHPGHHPPLW
jgi:hypothetical protein